MNFRYISVDEQATNTERVLRVYRVYRALVYRSPRMTRVLLACAFRPIRRVPRTILNMLKIVR